MWIFYYLKKKLTFILANSKVEILFRYPPEGEDTSNFYPILENIIPFCFPKGIDINKVIVIFLNEKEKKFIIS